MLSKVAEINMSLQGEGEVKKGKIRRALLGKGMGIVIENCPHQWQALGNLLVAKFEEEGFQVFLNGLKFRNGQLTGHQSSQ